MGILKGSQELPLSRRRANLLRAGEIQIGINTPPLGAEIFIFHEIRRIFNKVKYGEEENDYIKD